MCVTNKQYFETLEVDLLDRNEVLPSTRQVIEKPSYEAMYIKIDYAALLVTRTMSRIDSLPVSKCSDTSQRARFQCRKGENLHKACK